MIPYIHLGFFDLPTFGLMMWAAFIAGFFALNAEMQRRKLSEDPYLIIGVIALAGLAGAKFWHVVESPHDLQGKFLNMHLLKFLFWKVRLEPSPEKNGPMVS